MQHVSMLGQLTTVWATVVLGVNKCLLRLILRIGVRNALVFNNFSSLSLLVWAFSRLRHKLLGNCSEGRDQRDKQRSNEQCPVDGNTTQPVADSVRLGPSEVGAIEL